MKIAIFEVEDWEREQFTPLDKEHELQFTKEKLTAEEPVIREEAELLRAVYEESHKLDMVLAGTVMIRMRNVIVTPHSAFNTREAVQRIVETSVENIESFTRGEPRNTVDTGKS
jgi:lactate dehydrogenase-like 2-hydroxyacid dehydrogenase